jgi:hypothetical protein
LALRDILIRWRMQVDNAPIKQAQKDVERLNSSVDRMAKTFLGIYGLGRLAGGFMSVIQGASDTIETMNVLNQTFKANSSEVVAWSKTVGKTMGRSQYDLQKTAGQFGAFLAPQGFSGTELASMSEQLTALTVDLASFYNLTDQDAQTRLFSGLAGETEAVRRLGIDISDAGMNQFLKDQGKGGLGKFSALSMREKSEFRLAKILQDTVDKQGDAIRTYNEWENTWKRFQGQVKDVSVELGKNLIPTAKAVVKELSGWIPVVTRLAKESSALTSGLEILGIAAGTLAVAYAAQNAMMSAGIVAAGGLFLLFDELRTGLSDGPSDTIIGDFSENILGINDPFKSFAEGLQEVIGTLDVFAGVLLDFVTFIPQLAGNLVTWLKGGEVNWGNLTTFGDAARARAAQNQKVEDDAEASRLKARIAAAGTGDIEGFRRTYAGEQITTEQLNREFVGARSADIQSRFLRGEMILPTAEDAASGIAAGVWGHGSTREAVISAGQPTVPGQETGALDNSTVININGGNVQEVRKVVEDVMEAKNRRLQAVLSRTGQAPYTGAAF